MAEEIGELDLTAQANAAQTATSYITAVDSDGIKVHAANNASTNYAGIDATGMDVVRGGTSMAKFGEVTRIGKAYVNSATDNESHMELDYHSLKLVDKEGSAYFHVSDLRNSSGTADITVMFIGDGETRRFYFPLAYPDDTSYTIVVSDSSGGTVTKSAYSILFSQAPSDGAIITVEYTTSSTLVKVYTAGFRHVDSSGQPVVGPMSFAEGYDVTAIGFASHAEGLQTNATSDDAHAEGSTTTASGMSSHAEGTGTTASGYYSHAEGTGTIASGYGSHAEGSGTTASARAAHAEGGGTVASGYYSHAEGDSTLAKYDAAHAQNLGTIAAKKAQTAIGTYNVEDTSSTTTHASGSSLAGEYAFIIGNGTADDARSNALTVAWDGTMNIATPLPKTSGGTGQTGISQSTVTLSGCTVSGQRCWHNGVTCSVTMIDVKLSSALANGSSVAFGTIPSGYRPSQILYDVASSSNATFCGRLVFRIDQNGQLSLVNRSGSNLPANTAFSLFVTYTI